MWFAMHRLGKLQPSGKQSAQGRCFLKAVVGEVGIWLQHVAWQRKCHLKSSPVDLGAQMAYRDEMSHSAFWTAFIIDPRFNCYNRSMIKQQIQRWPMKFSSKSSVWPKD
jgi:hypothetical protein